MRLHLIRFCRASAWALLLALCIPGAHSADPTYLQYSSTGGPFFDPCPQGQATSVTGSQIGLVRYLELRFINPGTDAVSAGAVVISDLVGCEVPWNPRSGVFALGSNGASMDSEIGVRPTAATWSFTLTFQVAGSAIISYAHTFGATGIVVASSVAQAEISFPHPAYVHRLQEGSSFNGGMTPIGEPYEFSVRVANRSALQALIPTAPGWTFGHPDLTIEIENQLPASLAVDQTWVSTFRVTALTTMQVPTGFQCLNNDETLSIGMLTQGVVKPKLSLFLGTRQLSSNQTNQFVTSSTIGIPTIVSLLIRNNDTVAITYVYGIDNSLTSGCSLANTAYASRTLAAGQEWMWDLVVTPAMVDWGFTPWVSIGSPPYSRRWRFLNSPGSTAVPAPSADDSSSSSDSKCGVGSGLAALMTIALAGLCGSSLLRRRERRG